jgi:peptidyl-prolyl cis-trans isomerase C
VNKLKSILLALAFPAALIAAETDPVIISAGSVTVRRSEFESALKSLPADYQQYVASGPGKRSFAEDYLRMRLLADEGLKQGLDRSPDVVKQLELMKQNLVANAHLQTIESGVAVSEAELRKEYDANKASYEQVDARHILIAFKGSPAAQPGKPELTEAAAKAKADSIHKQLAGGADFAALAKTESDDTGSGANGGSLGTFGKGQMVPEFETAAFAAKVGELTPVVKTQFGYHVIKVEKHVLTPFSEVKESLEKPQRQKKLQAKLAALVAAAGPKYDETYFGAAKEPAPKK